MKKLPLLLLTILTLSVKAQYSFPVPAGWNKEVSDEPGVNAPHFPLKGIEDLRLPPGWPMTGSEEYWSAAYLFWLDPGQKIDAAVLKNAISTYYAEHIAVAVARRHVVVGPGMIKPVEVTIKKEKPETDDKETYTGTISMFDYLSVRPIVLNFFAHLKSCPADKHIPLFWEISPQPVNHPIWTRLKEPKQKFACGQ